MDSEDWFVLMFIVIFAAAMVIVVISGAMDTLSINECRVAGYDNGDQFFWQGETICWNVIAPATEEKREYFVLP